MAKLCSPLSTSPRSSFLNDLMSRPCSLFDELSINPDPLDILGELPSICSDIQKVEEDAGNFNFNYSYDYDYACNDYNDIGNNFDWYDEQDVKPTIMNIKSENDLMWPVLGSSVTSNSSNNGVLAAPMAAVIGGGCGTLTATATAPAGVGASTDAGIIDVTERIAIKQEPNLSPIKGDQGNNVSNINVANADAVDATQNLNYSQVTVKHELLDDAYELVLKQQQQQQQQLNCLNNIPPGTSLLRKSNTNQQQQQLQQNHRKILPIIQQQQQQQQPQQQQQQLLVTRLSHPSSQQQSTITVTAATTAVPATTTAVRATTTTKTKRDHLLSCSSRLATFGCDGNTLITLATLPTMATTTTTPTTNIYQRPDTPHSLDDDSLAATVTSTPNASIGPASTSLLPTEFRHDIDLSACIIGSNNISLSETQYIQQVSQELRDINKQQIGTLRTAGDYALNDILDVINSEVGQGPIATITVASGTGAGTGTGTSTTATLIHQQQQQATNRNNSNCSRRNSNSNSKRLIAPTLTVITSALSTTASSSSSNNNNNNSKSNYNNINDDNLKLNHCNVNVMLNNVNNFDTILNNNTSSINNTILTPLRTSEYDTSDNDDDMNDTTNDDCINDNDNINDNNDDDQEYIDNYNDNDNNDNDNDDNDNDRISICDSSTSSIMDSLNSPLPILANSTVSHIHETKVATPAAAATLILTPTTATTTSKAKTNFIKINRNAANGDGGTTIITNNGQKQRQQSYQQHMDHSYTRMNDISTNLDTPSDSEEEIDVVSINDRKLPTNPSDKDRRALQHKVAHKFSSRIVRSVNGVRTILPRRRGSYELPYTPVSSSPVKSVNNSRYPSPATTPYENQYTRKYVQQQQQLMKGGIGVGVGVAAMPNIVVNGDTAIATATVNLLNDKTRKRLLLNHQQSNRPAMIITTNDLRNYKLHNNNNNNNNVIMINGNVGGYDGATKSGICCPINNVSMKKYRSKRATTTVMTATTANKQQQTATINYGGFNLKRHYATMDNETADSIEKRNLHNNMERQRRIGLKNLFDTLKKQIPSIKDKERAPKVNILREAAKLCESLTLEDQHLMDQKIRLKEHLRFLKKRYNQLKNEITTKTAAAATVKTSDIDDEDVDVSLIMDSDDASLE